MNRIPPLAPSIIFLAAILFIGLEGVAMAQNKDTQVLVGSSCKGDTFTTPSQNNVQGDLNTEFIDIGCWDGNSAVNPSKDGTNDLYKIRPNSGISGILDLYGKNDALDLKAFYSGQASYDFVDLDGDKYGESLHIGLPNDTNVLMAAYFDNTSANPYAPGGPGWGYIEGLRFYDQTINYPFMGPSRGTTYQDSPYNKFPNTSSSSELVPSSQKDFLKGLNSQMTGAYSAAKKSGISAAPAGNGHLATPMTDRNWEKSSANLSAGYPKDFDPFPVSNSSD